jgi:hypothetical protein
MSNKPQMGRKDKHVTDEYKVRLDPQIIRFYREFNTHVCVPRKTEYYAIPAGLGHAVNLLVEKATDSWKLYATYNEGFWDKDKVQVVDALSHVTVAIELVHENYRYLDKFYRTNQGDGMGDLTHEEQAFVVACERLFSLMAVMVKDLKAATLKNGAGIGPEFLNEVLRERLALALHLTDIAVKLPGKNPQGGAVQFAKTWRGKRADVRKRLGTAFTDAAKFDQHEDRRIQD